jgi:hypothetical protein
MGISEQIQATAELCGQPLSKMALAVLVMDLDGYPPQQVIGALRRCRREHRGRLTAEAIVSRLDDGRPGVEEAWSMIPHSEAGSVVWTDEMAAAFGAASPLLALGDHIAARMAFREVYQAAVSRARDARTPPVWRPSLGWDAAGRETALREAVEKGRLGIEHARLCAPDGRLEDAKPALPAPGYVKKLAAKMSASSARSPQEVAVGGEQMGELNKRLLDEKKVSARRA